MGIMEKLLDIVGKISGWIWGTPMLVLLVGGGLFLTISLGFFQFRYFGYIIKQTFGKILSKETRGEGTVTPFQAATSALASTVGASNIVGVPVAIMFGGTGAIFWLWGIALLGSASKFTEVVLGLKYREKNEEGEWVGGPMYYIEKGLNWKPVSILFAFGLMIELVPSIMVQANSVAGSAQDMGISPLITGIIVCILVGLVVVGGIKRIGSVSEKLVPFMAGLYLIGAGIIILMNIANVPAAFALIFKHAFQPAAAVGGFTGAAVAQALRWGVARGCYSNEAGMGTAPMAHSAAITDHPVRQGFWGIFEVIVDTLVICTTTALLILTTGIWKVEGASQTANALPSMVFTKVYGPIGGSIVTFSLLCFVVSTIIVIIFYGEKQAEFLFGLKFSKFMRYVYLASIVIGAVGGAKLLWSFLDILLALIIVPNMISIIALRKDVIELTREFFTSDLYYKKDISKSV